MSPVRPLRTHLFALTILLLAAALACSPARPTAAPAATAEKPSVLIVVVDALRADRVGCYGNPLGLTPTIDALAADPDAVLFRRHYVQGAWTKPSTASLFTGLFAFQHGVMEGHEPREGSGHSFTTQVLDDDLLTMAERLRDAGFSTFGVVKSQHLLPEYGFAQGFEAYFGPEDVDGDTKRVDKVLEIVSRSQAPFFGYLHLSGPHHPFPPAGRDPEVMKRDGFPYDEKARIAAGVDFTRAAIKDEILEGRLTLEPDDVRYLNLLYNAVTRRVDTGDVARLIDGLKKLGVYDNTLLVLTADHGEELYDHGGYAHGHALWEEVIHVPMIVKFPRDARPSALPRDFGTATRAIDVLPSLLRFARLPAAPELPGEDIFDGTSDDFVYSQSKTGWAVLAGGRKLIEDLPRTRLFDLAADPGERTDLAPAEPERVATMRAAADALRQTVAVKPRDADWIDTELDEEAIEALRSLGYAR